MEIKFQAEVWRWAGGAGSWHFAYVPKNLSAKIKERMRGKLRGFGSVRVVATIGKTSWKTSIFPESKSGAYLLPVKSEVRKKEGIETDDKVRIICKII